MDKKCIIITGSTSGIGKELVKIFSQDKNNFIFAGYRNEKLISEGLENVVNFYIDMTNCDSIVSAAEFIKSKTDKVDTLINVAGCVAAGPIEKIDTDRLREQFDVNTFSHIEFTQNLIDILENSKIINISSMASFGHFPFISPYCASKRALDIFFNAFALENHKNIKVVSIKPGVISTPIWEKSVSSNSKYIDDCQGYENEMNYMKNHALQNKTKGLKVEKAAKFILKIERMKNPKTSYTLGFDAKMAQVLSILPQDILNKIIKLGMKLKIK